MTIVRFTNESGYDLSIAVWLADDSYDKTPVEGKYISVTGMLKPIRMIVLEQHIRRMIANDEVEFIDIDRYIASRLGTAIHSGIEHSWTRLLKSGQKAFRIALQQLGYKQDIIDSIRVNPMAEELAADPRIVPVYMEIRTFKKVRSYTIGGQFDFIGNGVLEDFKSMGVWGYMKGDKDYEQMMQGSMYRWLNPELVKKDWMRVQQIFTDWSKLDAMKGIERNYPQRRILSKKLTLLSVDAMDNWLHNKIQLIEKLEDVPQEDLPRCEEKDLWQDPPEYKYYGLTVKKVLSKTAKLTCDNYPEAHAMYLKEGGVGMVKEILKPVKRCGYCSAFDICTQKDEYQKAGILKMP